MLKTEQNTPATDRLIRRTFRASLEGQTHKRIQTDFEHGQWWVTCVPCGAQWSVCDSEPGPFVFEEVTHGEEDAHR